MGTFRPSNFLQRAGSEHSGLPEQRHSLKRTSWLNFSQSRGHHSKQGIIHSFAQRFRLCRHLAFGQLAARTKELPNHYGDAGQSGKTILIPWVALVWVLSAKRRTIALGNPSPILSKKNLPRSANHPKPLKNGRVLNRTIVERLESTPRIAPETLRPSSRGSTQTWR